MDVVSLIPVITGCLSAAVQIGKAVNSFWQSRKDQRTAEVAFQSSQPTATAAKSLHSLMDVQSAFWRTNPGMWKVLGIDSAKLVEGAYSKSNGYLNQLAVFAAQLPEKMDWKSSSWGIASVSSQLREMFAMHLGRVIAKMACRNVLKIFIPKEVKETIARENAKMLMQAQEDLGLLNGQMAAGEEGTRRQVQMYEAQAQQAAPTQAPPTQAPPTQAPPAYIQVQQFPQQPGQQPAQYPTYYIPPVPGQYQVPQQQGYPAQYQQGPPQERETGDETREAKGECIIS